MGQYKRIRRRVLIVFSIFGFIPLASAGVLMIVRGGQDAFMLTVGIVLLVILLLALICTFMWLKKHLYMLVSAGNRLIDTLEGEEREILAKAANGDPFAMMTGTFDYIAGKRMTAGGSSRISGLYETAIRCTDAIVWINDKGTEMYIIPESWRKCYPGLTLKNGEQLISCLDPDCVGEFRSAQRIVLANAGSEASVNARIRTAEEGFTAVTIHLSSMQTNDGTTAVAAIHDMDRIAELEKTVQEKYLMYHFVLQAVSDIIYEVDVDEDRYSIVNPGRWNEMFNIPVNGVFSQNRSMFGDIIHPDNKAGFYDRFGNYDHLVFMPDRSITYDYRILRKNGDWTWVRHTITCVKAEGGHAVKVIGMIYDINEKKQQEFRNMYNNGYDSLTGSMTRSSLETEFNSSAADDGSVKSIAVLALDVDGMGKINDLYGYETGNRLLQQVARILWSNQFENCYVARVGNDNFAILMRDTIDWHRPEKMAKNILSAFRSPVTVGAYKIPVSVSIGSAEYKKDGETFTELYEKAVLAMNKAAAEGKNRFYPYGGFCTAESGAAE